MHQRENDVKSPKMENGAVVGNWGVSSEVHANGHGGHAWCLPFRYMVLRNTGDPASIPLTSPLLVPPALHLKTPQSAPCSRCTSLPPRPPNPCPAAGSRRPGGSLGCSGRPGGQILRNGLYGGSHEWECSERSRRSKQHQQHTIPTQFPTI